MSPEDDGVVPGEERSFVEDARRRKRDALEAAGVPAFVYRYERNREPLFHDDL